MPPNNTIIQTLWNLYTRAVSVDTRNGRSKSRGPRSSTMKVEEEPNTSVQNLKLAAGERVSAAFKASSVIIAVE